MKVSKFRSPLVQNISFSHIAHCRCIIPSTFLDLPGNECLIMVLLLQYVAMERKFLKWHRPGNRFERTTGIHPADRSLLFRGIGLRMARCGLGSFFMVGGYYLILDHLLK